MSEVARQPQPRAAVLIVEDEPEICSLLSDMVASEGLVPRCVRTDAQACDALRQADGFACMIVDVNLRSGTTGYDVARFARQIDRALPVIFVSGQTSDASFRANGVAGSLFLPKPFTADELMERVRKLVGDNDPG